MTSISGASRPPMIIRTTATPAVARTTPTHSSAAPAPSAAPTTPASRLAQLGELLKADPSTVKNQLTTGTSLGDLLSRSGVSVDSLPSVLREAVLYDAIA